MRQRLIARDWVAVILAVGVAAAVVALACAAAVAEASENINLSEGAVTLLSTVLGAVVGAVATYLGSTRPGVDEPAETLTEAHEPGTSGGE